MNRTLRKIFIPAFLLATISVWGSDFRVGIARMSITPQFPIWLNGYAAREKPSEGKTHDLWVKALVIEENPGSKVIIVTVDILGLSREITEQVSNLVIRKYGISRSQLLLNSSHTHSAPVIWPALSGMFDFTPAELQAVVRYNHQLTDDMVTVIDSALARLVPMEIECGHGSAGFGMNRRGMAVNVSDPDVPIVRFSTPGGHTEAILCGYACHNTTLDADNILVNGDYSGYAMIELEKAYPGATAVFLAGCGADQDPSPRGTIELASQHGKTLAEAVQRALAGGMHQVRPPIRTDYTTVDLEFPPLDLAKYQNDILSDDKYIRNRAQLMLEAYNKWWEVTRFPYPVQAIRFNKDLTILGMGGEVVVDYSLNMKKQYPAENLFVAGYCSEVTCYIPSLRIQQEGGYEPDDSMIYYGLPGPFTDQVENMVTRAIGKVMKGVGARRTGKK
ncbi:MAG: neutral/alkaline non-lysosomal ceramidase N-terminal domain-containing protein [Bacteroidales bacterium]|jgi:hypothetical protein